METQNRLAELNGDLAKEKLYPEGEIRADKKLDEIVGRAQRTSEQFKTIASPLEIGVERKNSISALI
jgi:hypothetical protein